MASPESPKSRKSSKHSKKSPSSTEHSSSRIRNSPSKLNGQRSEELSNRKRKSRNSPGIEERSHEKRVKKEVPDREKVRDKNRNGEDRDSKNKDTDSTRKLEGGKNRNKDIGKDRDSRDRNRSNRSRMERSVSGRGENRDKEKSRTDRVGSRGGGDRNVDHESGRRSGIRSGRGGSNSERGGSRGGRERGSRRDWDDEKPGPSVQEAWGGKDVKDDKKEIKQEKPNYELSGVLQEEDAVHGVQVKYTEPSDGRVPEKKWRLYVFKDAKQQDVFRIHRLSAYLIGKERRVCDIPMHHPSISKQHAVLQYRQKPAYTEDGQLQKLVIKPYIIDLGSTNGTFLNGTQVEPLRYYELLEKDVLKFGFSSREYVLLHASSLPGEASPDNDAEVDSKLKNFTKDKSGDHV